MIPPALEAERGCVEWGCGCEGGGPFFFKGCPVMRACNKAHVFIVNRSLQLRGSSL